MSVKIALLPTRPINPQQEVGRHIYNLPHNQSAFPPHPLSLKLQTVAAEDTKKKIPYVKLSISSAGEDCSFILHHFRRPSLSFLRCLFSERRWRIEERGSLSLRPECLAVFKWRTRTCFCLPRQIHCRGRWANTHTHILTLGHRLVCPCLCLYAGWQPSHQLLSQWAQRITMATNIVGQAVAALGSVLRLFFGIHSVPESIR